MIGLLLLYRAALEDALCTPQRSAKKAVAALPWGRTPTRQQPVKATPETSVPRHQHSHQRQHAPTTPDPARRHLGDILETPIRSAKVTSFLYSLCYGLFPLIIIVASLPIDWSKIRKKLEPLFYSLLLPCRINVANQQRVFKVIIKVLMSLRVFQIGDHSTNNSSHSLSQHGVLLQPQSIARML